MEAAVHSLAAPTHIRRHQSAKRILFILPLLVVGVGIILANQPKPTFASVGADQTLAVTQPARFTFIWPVARTARVSITPHVDGELSYGQPLLNNHAYREITFTPTLTWQPDTTYQITLHDVESAVPGLQRVGEHTFRFTTAASPIAIRTSPDVGVVVQADTSWRVTFDRPIDRTSNVVITLQPDIPVRASLSEDGLHYIVTPTQLLPQGETVHLRVQLSKQRLRFGTQDVAEQSEPVELVARSWHVRTAPGVEAFAPKGTNIALDAPMSITFTEPIDEEAFTKAVSLTPIVVGEWQTDDNRTFTLQHAALPQRTTYTWKIAKSLRTQAGGFLPEDITMQFTTIGPVLLSSSSPKHAATGVDVANALHITFDQPVDHADAERRMHIQPSISGTRTWQGATLTFTPTKPLAFDTTYTVTFDKGVRGIAGYPSASVLTVRFTTEHATTRLAVPFHRQEHALSCEAATLVMALRYRGVSIGEQTLIDAIGFDPTPKKNGIWGDPDVAFVGDIDGQQPGTGYGVYAAPIAKAGSAYRTTRVRTGSTLTGILNEVKSGNPVIVWGNAVSGRRVDWKTSTGKTVLAIVGEHTRVVIGFTGTASNPVSIITLDPLYGEKHFTKAAFVADWALLGNMAVVVE